MKEFLIVVSIAAAVIAGAYWLASKEQEQWNAFAASHACRKVAHITGSVVPVTGFDSKGNVTFSTAATPDKTGWLCNDGVTYYR